MNDVVKGKTDNPAIRIDKLTKDYGDKRGCFNVSFEVKKGEVFGFLGPNGAGKTTAIRHMLGFLKPQAGNAYIYGKPTWENAHEINGQIGYIPGEINFPDKMTSMELVKWMAEMRGTKSLDKAQELLEFFEIDTGGDLKHLSKGTKQKIGIVCALMHDSPLLILDEPTSGLDPLMQEKFVELVHREKAAGKTILMSSHLFPEVERTCDRVAIIKQGEIVAQVAMNDIEKNKNKVYKVKFAADGESKHFTTEHPELNLTEINHGKNRVMIANNDENINLLLSILTKYKIQYISEIKLTLEDYFMKFYSNKSNIKGGM